jgi:UDP-glucose 4-epimerase
MSGVGRVLVTGGAGFIGGHLVDRLLADRVKVDALDSLMSGSMKDVEGHLSRAGFRFFRGDVCDSDVLKSLVSEADCVVHLAAVSSVSLSLRKPALTDEVNASGTLNVLKACVDGGVKRFVFASSAAVYGEPSYVPIDEEHPTVPLSPYGASKLAGERHVQGFCEAHGLKTVVLRLFNVYGPRQGLNCEGDVIARFMDCLHSGRPLTVHGDGSQTRDFVHVKDVVEAFVLSLKKEEAAGEVFNVGSGRGTSVTELAEAVLGLGGRDLGLVYEKPRKGEIKHSWANIEKAGKMLGYAPKVTLQRGLKTLLRNDAKAL